MKKIVSIYALACLSVLSCAAQQVIRLYDGKAPGSDGWDHTEIIERDDYGNIQYRNVVDPEIHVYPAVPGKNTGAAMVVCPGGAFVWNSWAHEGVATARWLAENGITAFVLKYRLAYAGDDDLPSITKDVFEGRERLTTEEKVFMENFDPVWDRAQELAAADGLQAVRTVRRRAAEWGIDPAKIGMMGFSAGAMVTARVLFGYDRESRPDFAGLIYGYYPEIPQVRPDSPPVFICAPQFDLWEESGMTEIYKAWCRAGIPAELHFFHKAGHGFGVMKSGRALDMWTDLMLDFFNITVIDPPDR